MGYDIFEEVDRLLEVVDDAVVSGNFSNLKKQVGDIVEPMKKHGYDSRFFENQGQQKKQGGRYGGQGGYYYGSGQPRNYNAGHMENRGNAFYGSYSPNAPYRSAAGSRQGNAGYNTARPQGAANAGQRQNQTRRVDPLRGETELFKKAETSLMDQVKQVIGIGGAVLFGIVAVIFIAVTAGLFVGAEAAPGAVMLVLSLFTIGVTAAFAALAMSGRKGITRMTRYVKYRSVLMKKSFASVKELSEATGVPEDKVIKELKELTAMGFFKQGHFDKKETTFICADEIYRLYQQSEESERIRQQEEAERRKQAGYIPDEVRELLDKGNEYVRKIHEANDKIPGEEVSRKLDRMENIVARIFAEVQKNPSLAGNLNMFMDYYLPTTTKLMDAYIDMDAHPVQGENIQNAKEEIEGTLDTINDAFENLLDSFFKETALDVSTDISVMKNMMRQQGLTPDDLEMIRRQQEQQLAGSPNLDDLQAYARKTEQKEEEFRYTAPTLEEVRKQLAEEDARAAREAEKKAGQKPDPEKTEIPAEKPLSFDEQLELEAQQGLLMTGNGDDDDIF
ncbi:MAG TPA: hypothetical protein DCG37_03425 [Lachnospiraceae bacterium]|nr:hypothetical protein [Lachnospiraceae bacterium]